MPTKHTEHLSKADSEKGFTLPELMIVIVLMGILAAIAIPSWFGLVESRDIESATNQVAADMRLAHSIATNRLGTTYLIFHKNNRTSGSQVTCNSIQADYCLAMPANKDVNGDNVINSNDVEIRRRYLPDRAGLSIVGTSVKINTGTLPTGVSNSSGNLVSLQFGANGYVDTSPSLSATPVSTNPRIRVGTTDDNPGFGISFSTTTSSVNIVN